MIYLVTGASASGKSEYAENLLVSLKNIDFRYYIATMQVYGEEGVWRVNRHKKLREGKGFITIEQQRQIEKAAKMLCVESTTSREKKSAAIVECISNLTANEMFNEQEICTEQTTIDRVIHGLKMLSVYVHDLVIVTNNVFDDGIPYEGSTVTYIQALAKINIELAKWADIVVEVTSGIPAVWKGRL